MAEPNDRKRRVRRVRKATAPKPQPTVPEITEIQEGVKEEPQEPIVETILAKKEVPVKERGRIVIQDNVLMDIVEKIVDRGKAVVISKGKDNQFLIHAEDASEFSMGRAQDWGEYNREVLTPEYLEWSKKWDAMTKEERIEFADEIKAEWEPHKAPRINSMRMAQAVREASGIEKYKEQYNTRSARGRLKPHRR